MKADLSRNTFDPAKAFARVLMQQGRVTLDADFNEQAAILLHTLRTMAKDLIGPHAAPENDRGFVLTPGGKGELQIGAGRYYVDGILVENRLANCLYAAQPDYPLPADDGLSKSIAEKDNKTWGLYLDVWERHISFIEDDSIREKALGGPDTCTRSKVVWQVKAAASQPNSDGFVSCDGLIGELPTLSTAQLSARLKPEPESTDPCTLPPDSRYRGAGNQLYRVEVHAGSEGGEPSFKWSRENGSVATAWTALNGNDLEVQNTRGFEAGNWVELHDDASELQGRPGMLVKLLKVEGVSLTINPDSLPPNTSLPLPSTLSHPRIRRWDQTQVGDVELDHGAVPVKAATASEWLALEDGLEVQFSATGDYRTGDYWLIPARVATGNIEWPSDAFGQPLPQPAQGIEHHYAPLGFVRWNPQQSRLGLLDTCNCTFAPIGACEQRGNPQNGNTSISGVGNTATPTEKKQRAPKKPPA